MEQFRCQRQTPQALETPKLLRSITIDRCSNFTSGGANGNDINLLSQLYKARTNSEKFISLLVYSVPDLKRIPFREAVVQEFRPTRLGEWFGPSWSTHWFHVQLRIPTEFAGEEVHFIWNADNEAMIWSPDGVPQQGLTGGAGSDARHEYILTASAQGGEIIQFYIEMACNGMFGAGSGLIGPPDPNRFFNLNELAQQYEWVKEGYPALWERIREKIAQNQFRPTGGTWVEMDTNMPSGESLCRHQRFFEQHFGKRCKVFWLPDSFGYSPQLPQLVRLADMKYFFTQKLSWNNVNKFPLTTFLWTGLDGTKVLTHMAPSETYNAQCTPEELIRTVRNHRDKEYSNTSLLVYGNGDGGGGPLASMIERLRRMKDVDGLSKVEMSTPAAFFENLEKESPVLPSWKGELYFELHRGIYTTHALCKKLNRRSEFLLRDIEMLATFAHILDPIGFQYPKAKLEEFWKIICLIQFHDVMAGSSIEMVYEDSFQMFSKVDVEGTQLREELIERLLGIDSSVTNERQALAVFNTLSWPRREIIEVPLEDNFPTMKQYSAFGRTGYALPWDVEIYHLEKGRTVEEGSIQILEQGPLRAALLIEKRISENSQLRQIVILTAISKRIDFETEVDWNENRQFLKVEFAWDILADSVTYETQYGVVQRPTHYNTSWDSAKFEVVAHKFADMSEYGYGVAILNDCKYGYSAHNNVVNLSLLRSPKAIMFSDMQCIRMKGILCNQM
ncbi:Glycoside hydrolase, 38 vacuolar alpha mannosidase [Apophysomyces sp. BC1034]|nr:Glycoside hydrolase, 38 vacuolar alpha mannosidase [Apophysomyces sp. BC1034]